MPAESPRADAFRFAVLSDPHHAAPECDAFFRELMAHMRAGGPLDFCLVLGDLADVGARESFRAMRAILGELGAPVYPTPGNHDCDLTQSPAVYAEFFPDRLNYAFTHRGWQFLAIDSTEANHFQHTRVGDEALAWLDAALPQLDPRAPTVLFTHFPLGSGVRFEVLNSEDVRRRFAGWNLRAVFCGHFHGPTERRWGDAVVLTNTCCSRVQANHDHTTEQGYLVCTAHADGRLGREFVEFPPASKPPKPLPAVL